jgi:hypothetical protein
MYTRYPYKDASIAVSARCTACLNCEFESRRGTRMSVSYECCLSSGSVLCVRMITVQRPYRVWSYSNVKERHNPESGRKRHMGEKLYIYTNTHTHTHTHCCPSVLGLIFLNSRTRAIYRPTHWILSTNIRVSFVYI